jgi:hypothetical protein
MRRRRRVGGMSQYIGDHSSGSGVVLYLGKMCDEANSVNRVNLLSGLYCGESSG